jgi:hypothetical protein
MGIGGVPGVGQLLLSWKHGSLGKTLSLSLSLLLVVLFGSAVGPSSSLYGVAGTREPPHEQWLTGMGAGAWLSHCHHGY